MKNFKQLLFVAALLLSVVAMAQTKVTGKVVDETNEPLPGASVVIKGTSTGGQTDFDGNFTLNAPSNSGTLVISFIGYEPRLLL